MSREMEITAEKIRCKHVMGFVETINKRGFKDFHCRTCKQKEPCKHKNKLKTYLNNGLIEIKCNYCYRFKCYESEVWSLSYGAGVNSSALYFYLVENEKPLTLVIMADTGDEDSTTLKTAFNMSIICKKDKIPFKLVKSILGSMVEHYVRVKAIPSIVKRDCTTKFKISPVKNYQKELYDYKKVLVNQYLGIAYDEAHRQTTSPVWFIHTVYPFVEDKIDRQGNIDILKKYKFKASKSGCMCCPFQSKASWRLLLKNNPIAFNKYVEMEENNIKFPNLVLNPSWTLSLRQFRNNILKQKSLNEFFEDDIEEEDMVCKNTLGGCFL